MLVLLMAENFARLGDNSTFAFLQMRKYISLLLLEDWTIQHTTFQIQSFYLETFYCDCKFRVRVSGLSN